MSLISEGACKMLQLSQRRLGKKKKKPCTTQSTSRKDGLCHQEIVNSMSLDKMHFSLRFPQLTEL